MWKRRSSRLHKDSTPYLRFQWQQPPLPELTAEEVLTKRSRDSFCRQLASTVETVGSDYSQHCNGFLTCVISSREQYWESFHHCYSGIVMFTDRHAKGYMRLLHACHFPWLAGHHAEYHMYDLCDWRYIGLTWAKTFTQRRPIATDVHSTDLRRPKRDNWSCFHPAVYSSSQVHHHGYTSPVAEVYKRQPIMVIMTIQNSNLTQAALASWTRVTTSRPCCTTIGPPRMESPPTSWETLAHNLGENSLKPYATPFGWITSELPPPFSKQMGRQSEIVPIRG